jgi:uncharacterized protein YqfA (UPF0365 family)
MSLRWKIYGLIALAFIAAALRWRASAVNDALALAQAERDRRAAEAVSRAQEVRDEVESMDTDNLKRAASKWVRRKDR